MNVMNEHKGLATYHVAIIYLCCRDFGCQGVVCVAVMGSPNKPSNYRSAYWSSLGLAVSTSVALMVIMSILINIVMSTDKGESR